MKRKRELSDVSSPSLLLTTYVDSALKVAKTARKNKIGLSGDNFYGNKLANLRAEGTNAFRDMGKESAGDVSAMAELMEAVFSPTTNAKDRLVAARELQHSLKTVWREVPAPRSVAVDEGLFPMVTLAKANRGYLTGIGSQMNGSFGAGWYDAALVMMRRLLEVCIIEAFEKKKIADKISDANGDYLHLSDLIGKAIAEPAFVLSRNVKRGLPKLRDLGHMSAHGRYFHATKPDIENVQMYFRTAVEEFLHHAGLA